MNLNIPTFKERKELFAFLVEHKEVLMAQKKSELKRADGVSFSPTVLKDFNVSKNTPQSLLEKDELTVKIVVNTTNLMDSHDDVHIPGLWDKSLSETGDRLLHLQEHKGNEFKAIIASGNDLKAYTQNFTFSELGYNSEMKTEALMFKSNVKKSRNEYMHGQYAKGYVTNHSVGMWYVKIVMAIDDEDYGAEKEAWDKYYPMIANKEVADKKGYFWAVTEAKVIEGSAVPLGSNPITPTREVKSEIEIREEAVKNWLFKS